MGFNTQEHEECCDMNWESAVYGALADGTLKAPPWTRERWYRERARSTERHYLHLLPEKPEYVAFYESPDKVARGILTTIRAGRYLKRFFGDCLNDKQIARLVEWQIQGVKPDMWVHAQLKFARTPKEIAEVYRRGPASCMHSSVLDSELRIRTKSGTGFERAHPCSIYGAGDLQVAYLEQTPKEAFDLGGRPVIARVLCWPEHRAYSRIYPTAELWSRDAFRNHDDAMDARRALYRRLEQMGWSEQPRKLVGARLLKQKVYDSFGDVEGYLMPYVDRDLRVEDAGEYWRLTTNYEGSIRPDSTSGYVDMDDVQEALGLDDDDDAAEEAATPVVGSSCGYFLEDQGAPAYVSGHTGIRHYIQDSGEPVVVDGILMSPEDAQDVAFFGHGLIYDHEQWSFWGLPYSQCLLEPRHP